MHIAPRVLVTISMLLGATATLRSAPTPANRGRYAAVNGLRLYYETHGAGRPLVLLHGGGSTIESTFGRVLPSLAKRHRVIAVELQAHGHTRDIDRPLSFDQDADDVAALLVQLHVDQADFMGFSNGGTNALHIAIRHPRLVRRLVLVSALFRRDGMQAGFFEGMQNATLEDMPRPLRDAFMKAHPDASALRAMFDRDRARMLAFQDIREADLRAIQAPALVLNGDADVVRPDHALALSRALPQARVAILPGTHGEAIGESSTPTRSRALVPLVLALIEEFLNAPVADLGSAGQPVRPSRRRQQT